MSFLQSASLTPPSSSFHTVTQTSHSDQNPPITDRVVQYMQTFDLQSYPELTYKSIELLERMSPTPSFTLPPHLNHPVFTADLQDQQPLNLFPGCAESYEVGPQPNWILAEWIRSRLYGKRFINGLVQAKNPVTGFRQILRENRSLEEWWTKIEKALENESVDELTLLPEAAPLWCLAGHRAKKVNDFSLARKCFQKALNDVSDSDKGYILAKFAVTYLEEKNYPEAIKLFTRALSYLKPNTFPCGRIFYNRGLAQRHVGNYLEAVQEYRSAIAIYYPSFKFEAIAPLQNIIVLQKGEIRDFEMLADCYLTAPNIPEETVAAFLDAYANHLFVLTPPISAFETLKLTLEGFLPYFEDKVFQARAEALLAETLCCLATPENMLAIKMGCDLFEKALKTLPNDEKYLRLQHQWSVKLHCFHKVYPKALEEFDTWFENDCTHYIRGKNYVNSLIAHINTLSNTVSLPLEKKDLPLACKLFVLCLPSAQLSDTWKMHQVTLLNQWTDLFPQFTPEIITQIQYAAVASEATHWTEAFDLMLHTNLGPFLTNSENYNAAAKQFTRISKIEKYTACSFTCPDDIELSHAATGFAGMSLNEGLNIPYKSSLNLDQNPWELLCIADAISVTHSQLHDDFAPGKYRVDFSSRVDAKDVFIAGCHVIDRIKTEWKDDDHIRVSVYINEAQYNQFANHSINITTFSGSISRTRQVCIAEYQIFLLQRQLKKLVANDAEHYTKINYFHSDGKKFIPKINADIAEKK